MVARIVLALAFATMLADFGWAESDRCVELARIIGNNYTSYLNKDEQISVAKADMCSEEYSKAGKDKQRRVQAAYQVYSGSISSTDAEVREAQKKLCENKFGEYWRLQLNTRQSQTVSAEGAALIQACVGIEGDRLQPVLQLANFGKEFTFALQYKTTSREDKVELRIFGPQDLRANECSVTRPNGGLKRMTDPQDVAQDIRALDTVTLICRREHKKTVINGVEYSCVDETILNIATSAGARALKLPRVCAETILESRADALETRIRQLKDDTDADRERFSNSTHVIRCSRKYITDMSTATMVKFTSPGECEGAVRDGWKYSGTLIGATVCGGFTQYTIKPDDLSILFNRATPCPGGEVTVHFLGWEAAKH